MGYWILNSEAARASQITALKTLHAILYIRMRHTIMRQLLKPKTDSKLHNYFVNRLATASRCSQTTGEVPRPTLCSRAID